MKIKEKHRGKKGLAIIMALFLAVPGKVVAAEVRATATVNVSVYVSQSFIDYLNIRRSAAVNGPSKGLPVLTVPADSIRQAVRI
ncbi:MAG: hypothetical protein HGA31_06965 [Candidatus Moranbacteria bacterium]|nr:hypothetical protein [Candidatus Moranbacteria bacterium]